MRKIFSWCAAAVLAAVLTGCGKPKEEPAAKAPESPKAQTVYGSSMEKAKSTDCLMQMRGLHGLWAAEEYLPTSANDLSGAGSALKCPGSGADYEFLVKGKVRNAGKKPVLRCPTHDLVLYSDGTASSGR